MDAPFELIVIGSGPAGQKAAVAAGLADRMRGKGVRLWLGEDVAAIDGAAPVLTVELSGGRLAVNASYQTAVPHIYAVGDVIGFPSLASTSMEQGRIAGSHAFGVAVESFPELVPFGIDTIPEISMVGMSDEQLGVHALGNGATELIHIGQAVIAFGGTIDYFVASVFNYPTFAVCYRVAALDGINRLRTQAVELAPTDSPAFTKV